MSQRIDVADLADVISSRGYEPFIAFGANDGSPRLLHCAVIPAATPDGAFALDGRCGRSTLARIADRPEVTMLWPAPGADSMSLIVDAVACALELEPEPEPERERGARVADANPLVRFVPVAAVLHRPASNAGSC